MLELAHICAVLLVCVLVHLLRMIAEVVRLTADIAHVKTNQHNAPAAFEKS